MTNQSPCFTRYICVFLFMALFSSLLPITGWETPCLAQETPPDKTQTLLPQTPLPPAPPPPRGPVPSLRDLYRQQLLKSQETGQTSEAPALPTTPGQASPQTQTAPADRQQPPAPPPAPHTGTFRLNFDDADVYSIIQTVFGEILKANYIVDPRVKGRVTFRAIAPVPFDNVLPLMEVILRLNGIGIVEENGLYRILPISDISKEPSPVNYGRTPETIQAMGKALLQVVPILYISSSEAVKLITPFASTNAVLIDVPKGNQIIIVDTDANVKRLLKLIEVFDNEKLKQRKPQVFVYQVQNGAAKDIASLLQQIFLGGRGSTSDRGPASSRTGMGSQTVPPPSAAGLVPFSPSPAAVGGEVLVSDTTRIIPDEITNTIVVLSTPEDYAAIKGTIDQIDVVPRQVVIEGMIASVALTDNLSLGLAALFKGSISNLDTSIGLNAGASVDTSKVPSSGFTFVGTDTAGAIRGLITALATESKAKLLATPHILVSDNREAKIQIGQQVPLVTSETIATPGVAAQRNIQYRDTGIILKAKPRVNEGGLVSLEIYQEISNFHTIKLYSNEDQIVLDKTDATTSLVVQDNQTIVIGGLIREDTSKARTGIPWLSKIPVLGWLFGNTDDDTSRQEVIILLTPHVIKNQQEAKDVSHGYIDKMSESTQGRIKKEELLKEKPQKQEEGNK